MSYVIRKRDSMPPLPTGDYPAELEGYEVVASKFDPAKESVKLLFGIVAPQEHAGRRLSMYVTPVISPKSKFAKVAAALLGYTPPGDLDLDDLLQKRCILTVTVADGDDGQFNKIAEARAPRATSPARPAPPPQRPAAPAPTPAPTRQPSADEDSAWWDTTLQAEAAALADTSASLF